MAGEGTPLPVAYIKAELCRTFHCLPSELEDESAEILKMAEMLDIADAVRLKQARRQHG